MAQARRRLRERIAGLARPRTREPLPVRLDRRRIYLLPTRFGLFFAGLLATMALGYPGEEAERALLAGTERRHLIAQATPLLSAGDVVALRDAVLAVHASDALVHYVQALLAHSRRHPGVRVGLSPRAGIALLRAARAHALLLGRDHVLPEDVQALFAQVAAHRLVPEADAGGDASLARSILQAVPVD